MTFVASTFAESRIGTRRSTARSIRPLGKPQSSPYWGLPPFDEDALAACTRDLLEQYPAPPEAIIDSTLEAWASIPHSRIGLGRIGVDIFPPPQVLGSFLHELIPLEMQRSLGHNWRGDQSVDEKDLVYVPDRRFSTEIKTSSSDQRVFGNRSYGQVDTGTGKKEKAGYYLAVNFTGWARDGSGRAGPPGVRRIRLGWLDHTDWLAQVASSGQAALLPAIVENSQLLTLYDNR